MKNVDAHVFWVLVLITLSLFGVVNSSTKTQEIKKQKNEISRLQLENKNQKCDEVPEIIRNFFKGLKQ